MASTRITMKKQTQYATLWGELSDLCSIIHTLLYEDENEVAAKRYYRRLQRVMADLPRNDEAIIGWEGRALLCELKGDYSRSIKNREREIHLIKKLHKSVNASLKHGDFDKAMGESILSGRDATVLEERQRIVSCLKQRENIRRSAKSISPHGVQHRKRGAKKAS